jgi:hypothetical protein
MKIKLLLTVIGLLASIWTFPSHKSTVIDHQFINDGPYIFNSKNELNIIWIENNVLREDILSPDNCNEKVKKFNLLCNYNELKNAFSRTTDYRQTFTGADSIGVISDIHGEYNTYISLLTANGIIDENLNWSFGKGHLVVNGDVFDRGNMVTEVFWHLFGLEKQAVKTGGMVHVLLGNHELMVLSKDLRFISEKYKMVEKIADTGYNDLYSGSSVLGKWLRTKPVIITINNLLFVHGGISVEMVRRNLKIDQINRKFAGRIIGKDPDLFSNNEELFFLSGDNGPVWYRGYFTDKDFSEAKIDSVLGFYGKNHIVVGHTPQKGITSLFNNKIIGSDTGIMYKQPGELLIYKNGSFYTGDITGNRIRL